VAVHPNYGSCVFNSIECWEKIKNLRSGASHFLKSLKRK
jgi:hypothetical protein